MTEYARRAVLPRVVIITLAAAAAVAAAVFASAYKRAEREAELQKNAQVLIDGVQAYIAEHNGTYPSRAADAMRCTKAVLQNPWTGQTGRDRAWMEGEANRLGIVGYRFVPPDGCRVTSYGWSGRRFGAAWGSGVR